MKDWFIFAGQSSEDFGLRIESYPKIPVPQRYVDTFEVPGRSGALHYEHDAFKNISCAYECYYHNPSKTAAQSAQEIKAWLAGSSGYQRLRDAYDPEFYRLARFDKSTDIETALKRYGRLTITFDCKPQRYSLDGDNMIRLLDTAAIFNPYLFEAKPLVTLYGSGDCLLTIGASQLKARLQEDDYLTVDSERMDVHTNQVVNRNGDIELLNDAFPILKPGVNSISWEGDVLKVEIIPRWWTL